MPDKHENYKKNYQNYQINISSSSAVTTYIKKKTAYLAIQPITILNVKFSQLLKCEKN